MRTFKNFAPHAARLLIGLVFTVFGLNGFLHFLPMPPLPSEAGALLGAFVASGYLMALVKGVEVAVGLLLLANRFVPLALALIAPVVVNIVAFHAFLAPAGMALPLIVLALELFLAWSYRGAYRAMLRAKVRPGEAAAEESESAARATATA